MDQRDRQILRILHELCTVALDSLPVASKDWSFSVVPRPARHTWFWRAPLPTTTTMVKRRSMRSPAAGWRRCACGRLDERTLKDVKMSMEVSQVRKQYWAQIVGLSVGLTAPVNSSQDALGLLGRPGVT